MTAPLQRQRWTFRRKADLVADVLGGRLTAEFAMRQHDISPEEWAEWLRKYKRWGHKGLRATKKYREKAELAGHDFAIQVFLSNGEVIPDTTPAEAPKRGRRTKAQMEEARRSASLVEIPPAALPAVEADPGPAQAALEQTPQEVEHARKGSRVSTTTRLKHTNRAKPEIADRIADARDYLARCGEMGAGEFQMGVRTRHDEIMALIASGDAESFESPHGEQRYRLRQPQPEIPEE